MSTAKFNQWLNSDGTENYKCRAWVNFNGTGTVAIRESGNVSSITDNGTGNYTINFTTAMPDANYSVVATSGGKTAGRAATAATNINTVLATSAQTVNGFLLNIFSGGQYDTDYGNVAIFR